MPRVCAACGVTKGKKQYTKGQWKKAAGMAVCRACHSAPPAVHAPAAPSEKVSTGGGWLSSGVRLVADGVRLAAAAMRIRNTEQQPPPAVRYMVQMKRTMEQIGGVDHIEVPPALIALQTLGRTATPRRHPHPTLTPGVWFRRSLRLLRRHEQQ